MEFGPSAIELTHYFNDIGIMLSDNLMLTMFYIICASPDQSLRPKAQLPLDTSAFIMAIMLYNPANHSKIVWSMTMRVDLSYDTYKLTSATILTLAAPAKLQAAKTFALMKT
jgi:hypothetical protein